MANPIFNVRLLRNQLVAMRRLPPGTQLPQPTADDERQLLSDLVRLADDVDPLRWLQVERGPLTARVLLREELQRLKSRVVGRQRISESGWTIPPEQRMPLCGLENLPADAVPFVRIEEQPDAAPEVLLSVLRQLRALQDSSGCPAPPVASTDKQEQLEHLIRDLLSLPDDVDPLRWLQTDRGDLAAVVTLGRVLKQCLPSPTLEVGTARHVVRPRRVLRTRNLSWVKIDELVVGDKSSTIALHGWLCGQHESRAAGEERFLWTWLGFDHIIDNHGYHYIVYSREVHTGSGVFGWRWSREHLRMSFYPSLASNTTAVTFISKPMIVGASSIRIADGIPSPLSLPEDQVGDLIWRVNLSNK